MIDMIIVGTLVFVVLTSNPMFIQPYFNPIGNAIASALFVFVLAIQADRIFVAFSTGKIFWQNIVVWIIFFVSIINFPIATFSILMRVSKSKLSIYLAEPVSIQS
jgi:hypothetical protein